LTFTTSNWSSTQTVTVTGVDDAIADGNQPYTVRVAATAGDPAYVALSPVSVSLTNTDNDSAGIVVTPPAGGTLQTSEAGTSDSFTIVLTSQPTADVTLTFTSSVATEATVSPATVTFTPSNWNQVRTVTATGVADGVVDGPQAFNVVIGAATSTDAAYAGRQPAAVPGINADVP
jgi:hypothetical protein